MWLGLQTVLSLERCPIFRVSFIERFHCIRRNPMIPHAGTTYVYACTLVVHEPAEEVSVPTLYCLRFSLIIRSSNG